MSGPEQIDLAAAWDLVRNELPAHCRWVVQEAPVDYDFSLERFGFREIRKGDVCGEIEDAWLEYLIFGEYDVGEGGGARPLLAIHRTSGRVVGIDFERDKPVVFPINSSLKQFAVTFMLLDGYLSAGQPLPSNVLERVREIDAEAFEKAAEWRDLIQFAMMPT